MPEQYSPPFTVRPFSFDVGAGVKDQEFPPVNYAAERAEAAIDAALASREQRNLDEMQRMLDSAAWWHSVMSQTRSQSDPPVYYSFLKAQESLGLLFIRAKQGSGEATGFLRELAEFIVSNLCSLIVHEPEDIAGTAATALINGLNKAVGDFEKLAKSAPNLIIAETRKCFDVPGLISTSVEQTCANTALARKLEVGTQSLVNVPNAAKGAKTIKLATPPNFWAKRLVEYIESVRVDLERQRCLAEHLKRANLSGDFFDSFFDKLTSTAPVDNYSPDWLQEALELKPFSPDSCSSWFNVAWKIVIDVTHARPEAKPQLFMIGKSGARACSRYICSP